MYIEDYAKKHIFGALQRSKLPGNITDYTCDLYIEDYVQGKESSQVTYFKFTPKPGTDGQSFMVQIDNIAPTKNLFMTYKIAEKEESATCHLVDRQEYKMQASVKVAPRPTSNLQTIQQSEDEYYPDDDMEIRMINFGDDDDSDSGDSSKCIEPSEVDKGKIRGELINFLHIEENQKMKLKQIKSFLHEKGFKVSEGRIKTLLGDICKPGTDKKTGYVLKEHYFQKDQYERKNPRKKIKQD